MVRDLLLSPVMWIDPAGRALIYRLDEALEAMEFGDSRAVVAVLRQIGEHMRPSLLGDQADHLAGVVDAAEGWPQWRLDWLAQDVRDLRQTLACSLAGGRHAV
jgi:hypothetical protein